MYYIIGNGGGKCIKQNMYGMTMDYVILRIYGKALQDDVCIVVNQRDS